MAGTAPRVDSSSSLLHKNLPFWWLCLTAPCDRKAPEPALARMCNVDSARSTTSERGKRLIAMGQCTRLLALLVGGALFNIIATATGVSIHNSSHSTTQLDAMSSITLTLLGGAITLPACMLLNYLVCCSLRTYAPCPSAIQDCVPDSPVPFKIDRKTALTAPLLALFATICGAIVGPLVQDQSNFNLDTQTISAVAMGAACCFLPFALALFLLRWMDICLAYQNPGLRNTCNPW